MVGEIFRTQALADRSERAQARTGLWIGESEWVAFRECVRRERKAVCLAGKLETKQSKKVATCTGVRAVGRQSRFAPVDVVA